MVLNDGTRVDLQMTDQGLIYMDWNNQTYAGQINTQRNGIDGSLITVGNSSWVGVRGSAPPDPGFTVQDLLGAWTVSEERPGQAAVPYDVTLSLAPDGSAAGFLQNGSRLSVQISPSGELQS